MYRSFPFLAALVVALGPANAAAQGAAPAAAESPDPKLKPEQIDALVAPIALYPDPLLSQALMASTYPLEIIQAQQWLAKNAKLKGDELEKAVKAQNWDPSVQATVLVPDLLKRLGEDITWTTNLGNAFLAQQQEVMDSVQRLRKKAAADGKLTSNEKMKVETQTVEQQQVIVIQQANPQVIYVPAYNPTVIWGPPPVYYPYPPVYYPPPPPPGAMLFTFSMGVMMGAAMHGGYCCGCGWGHTNTVVINNNNTFVNNSNRVNNVNAGSGNSNWQHNSDHRGGAPYGDKATQNKYGGNQRGGAGQSRPTASTMDRGGAGGAGGAGGNRGGGPSASTMDRGGAGSSRGGGPSASTMDRGGSGAGSSRVGNQSISPSSGGSAFGGSGGSANRAQASSSRGASSMASRPPSGGGGRGGGGGGRR
jgi:hypothetical protein